MQVQEPATTLLRYFSGMAEHTFEIKLGIVDPPLIDYLSDLLVRCVRAEELHSIRAPRGRVIDELGLMVQEAETRIGTARHHIYRCIGDFAMFWAGLYPESLRRTETDADLDLFGEYCIHGKRAYLIASSIPTDEPGAPPSDVLERLGRDFEMCTYGLREVRREWEEAEETAPYLLA